MKLSFLRHNIFIGLLPSSLVLHRFDAELRFESRQKDIWVMCWKISNGPSPPLSLSLGQSYKNFHEKQNKKSQNLRLCVISYKNNVLSCSKLRELTVNEFKTNLVLFKTNKIIELAPLLRLPLVFFFKNPSLYSFMV
jgi:hypothetical protein